MELIIDANIIFAALIKGSHTRHLLLREDVSLYAPEFLFDECVKHSAMLSSKTGLAEKELVALLEELVLIANVQTIPFEDFRVYMKKAEEISPDPDDTHYVALALKLGCAIWSNDKNLKEKQNVVKVYSTKDLSAV